MPHKSTQENRRKYQSNEYIKDAGLNWMDFNFRQYDPQIGRFNSVDPLAASGGQDMISPYAAMGNAPEGKIDPDGTFSRGSRGAIAAQMHSTYTYGEQEQAIADLAAHLNNLVGSIIMDALSGGGGSSGSWSGGGSYQQEYTIVVEIPNLVDLLTGGCSMLGVTSNFVCNFSAGGGGDDYDDGGGGLDDQSGGDDFNAKYYNGDPDKPVGTMSLGQANKWAHIGNGAGVYMDFTQITLPGSVTVERFKNSPYKRDGNPVAATFLFDGDKLYRKPNGWKIPVLSNEWHKSCGFSSLRQYPGCYAL